jgi:hypothetical protein
MAACIGANLATQVLKDVLPYPDKGVTALELNALPSGHTTLATSAAAAVFLVASPRWRPMAGFVGGTFAIGSGASTLLYQGHRPADVVAAFLLVGAFMIPAGWLVLRHGGSWNVWDGFGRHVGSAKIWLTLPVLISLASIGLAVYSLVMIAPGPAQETSTTNYFWAGTAFIVMTGYLAIVTTTSLFAYAARRRDSPER